jgi:MFS family permease
LILAVANSFMRFSPRTRKMVAVAFGVGFALVFNELFFPKLDPTVGTLAAFATFGVGFFARPFGGIVFGHFGDRLGRKPMLVMTLLLAGIATFLIGLVPTYEQIGVWAPVLLVMLRLVQGFGAGAEYGGAVIFAVEYAPEGKRGLFGSWAPIGVTMGNLMAACVFALVTMLPKEDFLAWRWRIPFLLSALLVAFGSTSGSALRRRRSSRGWLKRANP